MTVSKKIRKIPFFSSLNGLRLSIIKKYNSFIIKLRIILKWKRDLKYLPLTKDHWPLYKIIHLRMFDRLKKFPNLVDCQDFNDKIQWLKLFDQSEHIIQCSDKIMVRDYVRERVGDKYLVKMYQVHNHFSQIDFDSLPNSFVIKTNHDSGTVILAKDKTKLNVHSAEQRIEKSLSRTFGWENGEWAYSFIKPTILIEEYINPNSNIPPADYKFYTLEGKVKFCHYIYDRGYDTKEQIISRDGTDLKTSLYPSFSYGDSFVKPEQELWNEMISVAEAIGSEFKCVRVDLYLDKDKIYFGETTFWPMYGCYQGEGQKKLGKLIDFDRKTFKNPIYNKLKFQYS